MKYRVNVHRDGLLVSRVVEASSKEEALRKVNAQEARHPLKATRFHPRRKERIGGGGWSVIAPNGSVRDYPTHERAVEVARAVRGRVVRSSTLLEQNKRMLEAAKKRRNDRVDDIEIAGMRDWDRVTSQSRRGTNHKHPPGPRPCPKCGV